MVATPPIAGAASESPPSPSADREQATYYDLPVREGRGGLAVRSEDAGITLTGTVLTWTTKGRALWIDLSDIAAIHLGTSAMPDEPPVGHCRIRTAGGFVLSIGGGTNAGHHDEARAAAYAGFIHDIHRRLTEADRGRVRFTAGFSESRHATLWFAIVAGGLLFGVLPLVLLIVTGELETLLLASAGIGFLIGPYRVLKANTPSEYRPDSIPPELVPV